MDRPTCPCSACAGSGRAPLARPLWDVLQVLLADPAGEHTADSLAAQMGLKDTAMHNRLAKLRAAGLAHRASFAGRKAFWKAGAAPAAPSSP